LNFAEHEGSVREVAGVGESAKGDEFGDGVVVVVETVGEEDGVDGLELAHGGAALRKGHAPFPCLDTAYVGAVWEEVEVGHVRALLKGMREGTVGGKGVSKLICEIVIYARRMTTCSL
jgi:hypothetical protein